MDAAMEKGLPPDPAEVEAIGKLVQDAFAKRVFVSGEGLKSSSHRMHVVYKGGQRAFVSGPFADSRELAAGFALMRVRSRDEALEWCDRFAAILGDVELFLGEVHEPWDMGMEPKPADAPLRFLAMHKADARSESEAPHDPAVTARMGALVDEMTKAGVLQATGSLGSTRRGARIHYERGNGNGNGGKTSKTPRVTDGPFAESKELIAGYAIFELPSKTAALEWASRFGEIVNVNELEIRQMPE
jgi:hypothetical protein